MGELTPNTTTYLYVLSLIASQPWNLPLNSIYILQLISTIFQVKFREQQNHTARTHLANILQSTSTQSNFEIRTIIQIYVDTTSNLSLSTHYKLLSSPGWAIRTRKSTNPMSEKVKKVCGTALAKSNINELEN